MSISARSKGVMYSGTGEILECLFCDIISGKEKSKTIYEDDEMVVFRTIAPYTPNHVLTVPRRHIKSVLSLSGKEDAALLQRMMDVSSKVVADQSLSSGSEAPQLSFHVPPFNRCEASSQNVILPF